MRASDAQNAQLVRQAQTKWHFREQIIFQIKSLEETLGRIEARRVQKPEAQQRGYQQAERWALQQHIYILKVELRECDRYLDSALANLGRRLGESNAQVWKIIKGE